MEINEAIWVVRGMLNQKRAFSKTTRAHPAFKDEGYMQHIAKQADREAEALKTVCDALEAARNGKHVDVLAESGGDGRNGTP